MTRTLLGIPCEQVARVYLDGSTWWSVRAGTLAIVEGDLLGLHVAFIADVDGKRVAVRIDAVTAVESAE